MKVATMTKLSHLDTGRLVRLSSEGHALSVASQSENGFRFAPADIQAGTALVMTNYPHNPSGQIADAAWFRDLCQYCSDNDIRLFNDAAGGSACHPGMTAPR